MGCNCEACGGKMTGLAHIGIMVKDIEVSKAFYLDTLGMELLQEANNDGALLALVGVGSLVLELIQLPVHTPRPAGVVDHIAIAVDDMEPLVCKLVEKRIPFETNEIVNMPHLFGGIRNIFFSGPDGERLEFLEQL